LRRVFFSIRKERLSGTKKVRAMVIILLFSYFMTWNKVVLSYINRYLSIRQGSAKRGEHVLYVIYKLQIEKC
jgi:hypothetical protein